MFRVFMFRRIGRLQTATHSLATVFVGNVLWRAGGKSVLELQFGCGHEETLADGE